MNIRKFNFAKVAWLILLCFGITFISANYSQALPLPLTETNVQWGGTIVNVTFGSGYGNYYSDYKFKAKELNSGNWLEAFCVENATADGRLEYELIDVTSNLMKAAGIASEYFYGNHGWSKALAQVAIWKAAISGFVYKSGLSSAEEDILNNTITSATYGVSSSIGLVISPPGSQPGTSSQDYLISVPDASIMFLLGSALVGLGLFGRRRKSEL